MSCEPWMLLLGARSYPGAVILTALGSHTPSIEASSSSPRSAATPSVEASSCCSGVEPSVELSLSLSRRAARAPLDAICLPPSPLSLACPASASLGYNLAWPRRWQQFHLAVEPRGARRRTPLPRLAIEERGHLGWCALGPRVELSAAVG
ncbi:hypothetical protein PAHAL_4G040800 [Panicum hallii]|uniref:Uncharacterized protein n=1 Tax=Panicum hallii TaxID=206008 RepID=A0A2S3HGZ6_9POAL|nr:hypothetical protein PAHAL_4G040800 [Panicum hallii]